MIAKPALLRLLSALVLMLAGSQASGQLPYRVGDIVGTNFGLQNRVLWTNEFGQIFTPTNSTLRLYNNFAGKIVFFCFFDIW